MILSKDELESYTLQLGYSIDELQNMNLGETLPIGDSLNKIKRHEEDVWLFIRKDGVKTHIKKENSRSKDIQTIWNNFKESRDYNLRYAKDRCVAISNGFDTRAATRAVSSYKFMTDQVKTTSAWLSGESGLTKTLSMMADYIVFAKFDNKEQEDKYEERKKEIKRIENIKKKQRKEREEQRLLKIKEEVNNHPSSFTKSPVAPPKHFRAKSLEEAFVESNSNGLRAQENKVNYTRVDRQLEQGKYHEDMKVFWDRFSPSKRNNIPHYKNEPINYSDFAYDTMKQYIDEIEYLEGTSLNPERQKQISYLKSEMKTALDVLRKVIHFQPTSSIDETIPHSSWGYLSLRDPETYKALLLGYYDAIRKYSNKPSTSFWALLQDFKNLVEGVEWSPEEAVVIEFILETGTTDLKEIQEEIYTYLDKEVSHQTISNWINKNIPNKLHSSYEKLLEDWIWINRRKGTYKTCNCCGNVYLAVDNRYFNKDSKGKLGLKAKCKSCEKR